MLFGSSSDVHTNTAPNDELLLLMIVTGCAGSWYTCCNVDHRFRVIPCKIRIGPKTNEFEKRRTSSNFKFFPLQVLLQTFAI
jgi:hypothetical protein